MELYLSEGCPPVKESHKRWSKATLVGGVLVSAVFGLLCWCKRRQAAEGVSADNNEPCTTTTTTTPTIAVVAAVRLDDDDYDDDKEEEGLALLQARVQHSIIFCLFFEIPHSKKHILMLDNLFKPLVQPKGTKHATMRSREIGTIVVVPPQWYLGHSTFSL